jgi:hypothetical protein
MTLNNMGASALDSWNKQVKFLRNHVYKPLEKIWFRNSEEKKIVEKEKKRKNGDAFPGLSCTS